jgi:hypothetical protein
MKKTILIAAVMLFALSSAAMAQIGASWTVSSTPETFVSCCGQTEKTGDIAWSAVPGSPNTTTGTIQITYAVPVTNTAGPNGITVSALAPSNPTGGIAPVVTIPAVGGVVKNDGNGHGVVTIAVAAGGVYPYTIHLTGVRVDVSGACSGSLSANITSTGNLMTSGETSVVVISNVKNAFAAPTATAVTVNGVTGTPSATSIPFSLKEGYLNAFGLTTTSDPTQTISKMVRLTVSKVPAGVTLTFPVASTPDPNGAAFTLASAAGVVQTAAATVTSTTTATGPAFIYYRLTTDSNAAALEALAVNIGVTTAGPFPLSGPPVTISAHIAPFDAGVPQTLVPRYADLPECETAPVTVLSIQGASTTLLVPYAVNMPGLIGYNTGLAVANTTTDPGTTLMGFTTAVKQAGAMTFYFYPQTGTAFTYATTAGSPGSGLNADGTLKTGGIYVVLLDQLLKAANASADFSGYIFIITNFTNGHGQYFISNFDNFSNGALMLVVNNESVGRQGPEKLDN